MTISLLIDGYNLLHATGAVQIAQGPAGLVKARQRMLGQIAAALDEPQRLATQVVFDAGRSKILEPETRFSGITVTFAVDYPEADDLIEKIIRQHSHPRSLSVVSSDSRIQRAARARGSIAVDCDRWLMQTLHSDLPAPGPTQVSPEPTDEPDALKPKAAGQLSPEEVEKWMKEFGI